MLAHFDTGIKPGKAAVGIEAVSVVLTAVHVYC
jgi:hypothetical protein